MMIDENLIDESLVNKIREILEPAYRLEYEKGLDAAWECARNLFTMPTTKREYIFGTLNLPKIFDYSAAEVISKIKDYENNQKQDNEIKVGDEVYLSSLNKYYPRVVLSLFMEDDGLGWKARTMLPSGFVDIKPVSHLTKTGRNFSQILNVLKQLQEV